MPKIVTYSIHGLKETQAALMELPKATAKNVGRRALRAGGELFLADYQRRAPRLTGHLVETSGISTKLSRRQRALQRKEGGRDHVEMFVGAGPNPQAVQQEFGNENHPAQPAMIPAWESNKMAALQAIGESLWSGVRKAAARAARKTARLMAGGD